MTPGLARVALFSFLLVAAGVVVNAHFLQTRPASAPAAPSARASPPAAPERTRKSGDPPRAAPRWPAASAGEGGLRIARFAPDQSKLEQWQNVPQETAGPNTVLAIERELTARGYGPLGGDGATGAATQAAIMAFEHDHGLPLTGEASEALLKRILLGASAGIEPAGSARRASPQAERLIRGVQQRLAQLGYRVGNIDGRMGEETIAAIRDFEMDNGLVPKGRVSADLVTRLAEPAAPKPKAR